MLVKIENYQKKAFVLNKVGELCALVGVGYLALEYAPKIQLSGLRASVTNEPILPRR